jgi:hypothetical protein
MSLVTPTCGASNLQLVLCAFELTLCADVSAVIRQRIIELFVQNIHTKMTLMCRIARRGLLRFLSAESSPGLVVRVWHPGAVTHMTVKWNDCISVLPEVTAGLLAWFGERPGQVDIRFAKYSQRISNITITLG